MNKRKLILYIAASVDGFIAGPDDNLDFLEVVRKKGEDYGYSEFISTVDTIIIGRRTYDWVIKEVGNFPHDDMDTYVITRRKEPDKGKTKFYTGNIQQLVQELKAQPGKNIFCDGGAEIVDLLLADRLLDELIISVIPVLVGRGIKLFSDDRPEQNMKLISCRKYETGLIQLHYRMLEK